MLMITSLAHTREPKQGRCACDRVRCSVQVDIVAPQCRRVHARPAALASMHDHEASVLYVTRRGAFHARACMVRLYVCMGRCDVQM